ncbi:MAG: hypothetical protein V4597_08490 [Pseudomonadota bacterium]
MATRTRPTAGPSQAATRRTPSSARAGEGPATVDEFLAPARRALGPVKQDAWSAFCEAHGTRCSVTSRGERCEGGAVGTTGKCGTHQTAESLRTVRQAIADEIVSELTCLRPDVVEGYKSDDPCRQDFVFVEEGVSAALEPLGLGIEHVAVCGLVFAWLKAEHGVEPPAWYRRRQPDGPTLKDGALALFEEENGARHRRIEALRVAGMTAEFSALYAEEKAWLQANGIAYSPAHGWHFIDQAAEVSR